MELTVTTTTVTPEVETPRHFADCDSLAIGRRVKTLIDRCGPTLAVAQIGALTTELDSDRGNCSCFALQLARVEADLAARRKAQRAGHSHEAEIQQLLAARTALREATR